MQKTKTDKRSRLIQTAAKLAYRQGFRKTTLADIAEEAQVPLGNVYYYFKTKDELAAAVVELRLKELENCSNRGRKWTLPKNGYVPACSRQPKTQRRSREVVVRSERSAPNCARRGEDSLSWPR